MKCTAEAVVIRQHARYGVLWGSAQQHSAELQTLAAVWLKSYSAHEPPNLSHNVPAHHTLQ
jgi:hypothetical protein